MALWQFCRGGGEWSRGNSSEALSIFQISISVSGIVRFSRRTENDFTVQRGQLASRFHLEACYDCATRASRAGTAASSRCLAAADDSEGVFLTSGRAFPSVFSRSPEINA